MPVPDLSDKERTREEVIEAYKECGWEKRLTIEWIEIHGKQPRVRKLVYSADAMPCGQEDDAEFQLTFITLMPTGVFWTCAMCRQTQGPLSTKRGRALNGPIGEEVSIEDAYAIIRRTGQQKPVGMPTIDTRPKLRIIS